MRSELQFFLFKRFIFVSKIQNMCRQFALSLGLSKELKLKAIRRKSQTAIYTNHNWLTPYNGVL